jgi:hypothetical protein
MMHGTQNIKDTSSLHMPAWHAQPQLYLHRGTFLAAKLAVKQDIKVGLTYSS